MDTSSTNVTISPSTPEQIESNYKSLNEIVDHVLGRNWNRVHDQQDWGSAEAIAFPFLALVDQVEMKYALLLALINTAIKNSLQLVQTYMAETKIAQAEIQKARDALHDVKIPTNVSAMALKIIDH